MTNQHSDRAASIFMVALGMITTTLAPFWSPQTAEARTTFFDIRGSWAQMCIEELAQRGIVEGYPDGNFRPNQSMQRDEYAAMVRKAFANAVETLPVKPFFDVPARSWSLPAIRATSDTEFFVGYPGGDFQPQSPITRTEAMLALVNGLKYTPSNEALQGIAIAYEDDPAIPTYALNALAAATENRLVVNYPNVRYLNPTQPATRAEAAAFICQALASAGGRASAVPTQYIATTPTAAAPVKLIQISPTGSVQGQLSYEQRNYLISNMQLKVVRNGEVKIDEPLPVDPSLSSSVGFQVRDLDGDREPEIMVDLFVRGDGCCAQSYFYRYIPLQNRYQLTQQPWGYLGYELKDLDQDGVPEIESGDTRFNRQFASSYTDSAAPLQIWQYRQGQLFEVTRQYSDRIYQHASMLWQESNRRLANQQDVKGLLAAYLADKYLLGQGEEGWRYVQQAYQGSDRVEYFANLRAFLRDTGYTR